MKLKIGPGINEVEIYGRDGEQLVGKDQDGKWFNKLSLTGIFLQMRAQEIPTMTLECEVFGYEQDLEIEEERITALLTRNGITKIEKAEKDADLHTDA